MSLQFDSDGKLVTPSAPTQGEVDALVAYMKAIDPDQHADGLALSDLRPPNSQKALVRYEAIAFAAQDAGLITVKRRPTKNGGHVLSFHWNAV
jgi:hypothetical protein